ncbi:extracellular solute-binding protein [Streptomyces sp. NBC_01803]|uniref:extracellular solute-binding protein n=1 Tax=Streptomyces sp. NBC_01803 TaxID=2975946 RepID=UPI002DDA2A6F|nr:extracellular solute-binding protein [Streptomyces sp. NBC_01803]WSA44046.1 extracellular solute-binding protein [Streptomyces sp. NBC_01803]
MTRPTPRAGAIAAGTITAVLALNACGSDSGSGSDSSDGGSEGLAGSTIVVSAFPFGVEEFEANVVEPFEEATGANVEIENGSNADRLTQLQLAAGDPGIDVMLISDTFAALGQSQDLFQEFDAEDVPNLDALSDFALDDAYAGPAYTYQLNGILYRTDELSAEQAADWSLFGNPDYAGRLALPDISATAGQLTVSGIGEANGDGPYDVDSAFSTMGEWAPDILQFYTATTEVTNLITQGEIAAVPTIIGFVPPLIESGQPVSWTPPAEGRYMATNRLMIPEGAPNTEGAHAFIDYMLSQEAQQATTATDLPVRPDVEPAPAFTDLMGEGAADPVAMGYQTLDPEQMVDNRTEWVERFAREVSGQ